MGFESIAGNPPAFRQVSLTVRVYQFILLGGERHLRVKCLAQEHNTVTRPGLEPGPLDPESIALTTRPPRLPQFAVKKGKNYA